MAKLIGKAAILQSAILGAVKTSEEPATINDLMLRTNILATKAAKEQVWSALTLLHKRGLLRRVRVDRLPKDKAVYAYELGDGSQTPARKPAGVKIKAPLLNLPADVRLDYITETGRLRIQFKELVIELGVV